jgi:hypothetical protein
MSEEDSVRAKLSGKKGEEMQLAEHYESSNFKSTSSAEEPEFCSACGVSNLAVESKFHRGCNGATPLFSKKRVRIGVLESGSEGCDFCKLIVDAIRAWKVVYSQRVQVVAVLFKPLSYRRECRFRIEIFKCGEPSGPQAIEVELDVFRMEGV